MRFLMSLTCVFAFLSQPAYAENSPKNVVSIGGATTEIIYALGKENLIVGTDTSSYYPEAAKATPKVGYQRTLSAEGVLSLKPDLIFVHDNTGPEAVVEQIKQTGVRVVHLKSGTSLDEISQNIQIIAETLDATEPAKDLTQRMANDLKTLQETLSESPKNTRAMFVLQHGNGPAMVAGEGSAAAAIIALSGATNVGEGFKGYKPLTPESAVILKPDVIITTTESMEQHGNKAAILTAPGMMLTPAGKNNRVIVMDSLQLLGFGPRTAQAALELHKSY